MNVNKPVEVEDTYGDVAIVTRSGGRIYLDLEAKDVDAHPVTELSLNPDAARKIAKALKRAAKRAEVHKALYT